MHRKPGDKVVVFGCGPLGPGRVLWLVAHQRGCMRMAPSRRTVEPFA